MAELNAGEQVMYDEFVEIVDYFMSEANISADNAGQWKNEARSALLKVDLNDTACSEFSQMLKNLNHIWQGSSSYRELRVHTPEMFSTINGVGGKYGITLSLDVNSYANGGDSVYITLTVTQNGKKSSTNGYRKYEYAYESEYGTVPSTVIKELGQTEIQYAFTAEDLPELTADGHIFSGWTIDGTTILSAGDSVLGGETLTAVWDKFIITYETAYGTTPESKSVALTNGVYSL